MLGGRGDPVEENLEESHKYMNTDFEKPRMKKLGKLQNEELKELGLLSLGRTRPEVTG